VIIAITNQKGGSARHHGNNLAAAFARRGTKSCFCFSIRRLIVPSRFWILFINGSVYELMMDGQMTSEMLSIDRPSENLDIVPARISLAKLESKIGGDFDAPFRFER